MKEGARVAVAEAAAGSPPRRSASGAPGGEHKLPPIFTFHHLRASTADHGEDRLPFGRVFMRRWIGKQEAVERVGVCVNRAVGGYRASFLLLLLFTLFI
jgi:hypothetical protein